MTSQFFHFSKKYDKLFIKNEIDVIYNFKSQYIAAPSKSWFKRGHGAKCKIICEHIIQKDPYLQSMEFHPNKPTTWIPWRVCIFCFLYKFVFKSNV